MIFLRKIRQYRSNGAKIFYMDETWVYEGMSHTYDWVDQAIKKNPLQSYRQNFTTGPREPPTRGKRAIVIGYKIFIFPIKVFLRSHNRQ